MDADPAVPVSEVATALAQRLRCADPGCLWVRRIGEIGGDMAWGRAALRDGDIVSLSGPFGGASPNGRPAAELVVVGGPEAGRRSPLAAGSHAVGRGEDNTVILDDPSLSSRHLEVHVAVDGSAQVNDAGSTNGTAIDGVALVDAERRTLGPDDHVEAGRSMLTVRPWREADPTRITSRGARLAFNRPPRVSRAYEPPTLRVGAPPQKQRKQRIPLVTAFIPLIMGLVLWLVIDSYLMLIMAAFTPFMMLGSVIGDRRSGRKEHREAVADFDRQVTGLEVSVALARREEIVERRAAAPDAAEIALRAERHLPELWERRPQNPDFLDVRVAVADQAAVTTVAFAEGGEAELRERVDKLMAANATVPAVPVRIRLTDVNAVGLAGEDQPLESLARWLVVQLTALHSPRDMVLAAALSPERAARWDWLHWLPHTHNPVSPLEGDHIAIGPDASRELLRNAARIAAERREEDGGMGAKRNRRRTVLMLLVDDEVAPERAVVDELLDDSADVDVVAIWLAADRRDLPGGCGALVELHATRAACDITWAQSGQRITGASVDGLPGPIAAGISRALAPVIDVTAGGAAADIPRFAPLPEVLELVDPTPAQIAARWRSRASSGALDATIGAAAGRPFSIDLRADGPHALIAGTTGAGKSELLQSLVAALAASHPPNRLTFLFVDYKGGAAFRDCVDLPHTAGMVTDLDAHEVHRALLSLNAELRRREHLLKEADVKDLLAFERQDPSGAPPSLAIVIDEFATLAKEVPEFVEGVVDVAQRGRSLGVHLVLATQRPGNAVTENIRANTNLRVCLRVGTAQESDDVIGTPDAARLPRSIRGRALARTGPSEVTAFQVAYGGGRTGAAADQVGVEVRALRLAGLDLGPAGGEDADGETDLEVLVTAMVQAAHDEGIERPRPPWLAPLPHALGPGAATELATGAGLVEDAHGGDGRAAIGVVDEPRRQRRTAYEVDLATDGSLLIYGGTGAGKTTALRTLAATLALQCTPDELNVYGLDFAGRGLTSIEALPHCGSVIPGEDEQRVDRLIGILRRTIEERSRAFAEAGVLDLDAYRRAHPDRPLARILVLLDSYAGFTDTFEKVDLGALVDAVPRMVADGRAVGVHFAITADRRMAVPSTVSSVIARRIILRMATEDEYQVLGLQMKAVEGAVLPPGRGFLDDGREVQIAVLGASTDPEEQGRAVAALARELEDRHGTLAAPPITQVPLDVPAANLPAADAPLHGVIGVDALRLQAVVVSAQDMHFTVVGPYRSGRSTALGTLARALHASTPDAAIHLLAPRRSPLTALELWSSVATGMEESEQQVTALAEELLYGADPAPAIIVIDDAGELAESMVQSQLEQLLKKGRDGQIRMLVGFETAQARHYAQWVRETRKDGHGLLLDPDLDLDGELLGTRLPRRSNPVHPPGRGYLVAGGVARLIQVAR